jgi:hypothetical protein
MSSSLNIPPEVVRDWLERERQKNQEAPQERLRLPVYPPQSRPRREAEPPQEKPTVEIFYM